ncbi:MAG TPA: thioredoxin family protein [Streptosporangiaceae bacterium]
MTGTVIAIVALVAATAIGLLWRRRDGRLRPQRAPAPASAPAAEAAEAARAAEPAGSGQAAEGRDRLTAADLGADLGDRATLVQFSTAFCAPCRATRGVLGEVAAMVSGVRHVEIDAESRLDLVRRLGVLRTPTVLILDGAGHIVRRGSGRPRKADVIAALGDAIPADPVAARDKCDSGRTDA